MLLLFWISITIIVYIYIGYPLMVLSLGKIRPCPVLKNEFEPDVTILIAAYNEAEVIEETVRNKLLLDYPKEKLEIIVISDGSDDETDKIVKNITENNVKLLRQEPRAGKTSALNLAIGQAKGEIILFSDANSLYSEDALRKLTANFNDPTVGYVTGKMVYVDPDGSMVGDGCGSYMRYENFLRSAETRFGSVVGVDGGIDAVRKVLYSPMRADQLPDFVLPLKVIEQGRRVVYEEAALLHETTLKKTSDEYRMRVRVSLRAFWALWDMRKLLGTQINLLFAWQLWSHKLLRYFCFLFLSLLFVSNLFLVDVNWIYLLFFLLQFACYAAALAMPWLETRGCRHSLLNFARYFLLLNVASAHAFCKFASGQKQVMWTPRKG